MCIYIDKKISLYIYIYIFTYIYIYIYVYIAGTCVTSCFHRRHVRLAVISGKAVTDSQCEDVARGFHTMPILRAVGS